jgi:hypothetical protein
MKVTYVGPHDAVEVPLPDGSVELVEREGKPLSTSDAHAKSLLEQDGNWKPAEPAKSKQNAKE